MKQEQLDFGNRLRRGKPDFNGPEYSRTHDKARLTGQIERVFNCMIDGDWRTLSEIEAITGDPPASISAQLRHLRKPRFGSYIVERRPRGNREHGLFEYRVLTFSKAVKQEAQP